MTVIELRQRRKQTGILPSEQLAAMLNAGAEGGFQFNRDYKTRDKLLNMVINWRKEEIGEIAEFDDLRVDMLAALLQQRFIDPAGRQNCSPTVMEFYAFMAEYPQALAGGYAVSPRRSDYRVSLDRLYVPREDVTAELRNDFAAFCQCADRLELEGDLESWWD